MLTKLTAGAALAMALFAGAASAATTLCEFDGNPTTSRFVSGSCDASLSDFDDAVGSPVISVTDSAVDVFGFVAHRSATTFRDGWTFELDGPYAATFTVEAASSAIDGTLFVDGVPLAFAVTGAGNSQTIDLGVLRGTVGFQLDPILGTVGLSGGDELVAWDIALAAVPVPAAGLLLVGALGGLAATRRRKTN